VHRFSPRSLHILGFILCVGLGAPVFAQEEEEPRAPFEPAVPPGNEELLLDMLGSGASLPENCSFANGQVEYTIVRASYRCPTGDVVVELAHPDRASPFSVQTERFALTVQEGSPPESLADAVAALIREREESFEWTSLPEDEAAAAESGTADEE
jgi:hypothetical protein